MSAQRQHGSDSWPPPVDFEAVESALESISSRLDALHAIERLRSLLPPAEARFAAGLRELRRRAHGRFPGAERALLTRKGLEQSTRVDVANARAKRFLEHAGGALVLDSTCGLGGDALALARAGVHVIAMDRELEMARMAHANLERAGQVARVLVGDAARPPVDAAWWLADPDRRAEGQRSLDPERWSPALTSLLDLARKARGACIKLPPSFDPSSLPADAPPHRLQWVSQAGELCEVALWTGAFAPDAEREVLSISRTGTEARLVGSPRHTAPIPEAELEGARYLADPDPALVRSGLLGLAASEASMAPLGPRCAYLAGARPAASALLPSWRVLGSSRADVRAVRRLLAEHDIGAVAVRKRGHPDPAEVLARRFAGSGSRRGHLAFARLERGHRVFLLATEAETAPAAPHRPS